MRRSCVSFVTVCCLVIAVCLSADAQGLGQRAIQRFDSDGDGRLSLAERRAARELLARRQRGNMDLGEAEHLKWQVGGLEREALVYLPSKAEASEGPAPVVSDFTVTAVRPSMPLVPSDFTSFGPKLWLCICRGSQRLGV